MREASERLHDRDRYGDVLDRPISAFIDAVCRDLGLAPDWRRLAEQAWAQEEIASGAVGEPLKAPFSSRAGGGGGPQPVQSDAAGGVEGRPVEGMQRPASAPSVAARWRRVTSPLRERGEKTYATPREAFAARGEPFDEPAARPAPTQASASPSPDPEPQPAPPPPPPLTPRERRELEDDIAYAHALPGELPPRRVSRPFAPP